jgi:hypothetical protein
MPDTGASRKPQIVERLIQGRLAVPFPMPKAICVLFVQQLPETSAWGLHLRRLYVACAGSFSNFQAATEGGTRGRPFLVVLGWFAGIPA